MVAAGGSRVFITAAARDWSGYKGLATIPGYGKALVYAYAISPGGFVQNVVARILFSETPRALAVSPDGLTVYAAGFQTGNQTTTIPDGVVCDGGAAAAPCSNDGIDTMPGGMPAPNANVQGINAPEAGLIVQYNPANGHWEDELLRDWSPAVKFTLPDSDVFPIDAMTRQVGHTDRARRHHPLQHGDQPGDGKLYVSNTEARNADRFEGPGSSPATPSAATSTSRASASSTAAS